MGFLLAVLLRLGQLVYSSLEVVYSLELDENLIPVVPDPPPPPATTKPVSTASPSKRANGCSRVAIEK